MPLRFRGPASSSADLAAAILLGGLSYVEAGTAGLRSSLWERHGWTACGGASGLTSSG